MHLSVWGAACLPLYLAISLAIGWLSRPQGRTSANNFFNASGALPLPLVVAAFLAANCGALEVIGLSAMAAQYGALAFHFYWIGAIPALLCLCFVVLPAYKASGVPSVPRFLGVRFGQRLALINALSVAAAMLMLSGISLYAMAQVLQVVMGISFAGGVLSSAAVVLVYVSLGGVRATIYTEVFQLFVMVAGLLPLSLRCGAILRHAAPLPRGLGHAWAGVAFLRPQAPMDGFGLVFGLGLVLSFGYWCTDFVLMQRALAARSTIEARSVPLWAGFGKLLFSLLVVVPGLAATLTLTHAGMARYDQSLPGVMAALYGPTLLGLGLTALAASLMSGMAANVSGFAAVWTEDLYRRRWHRDQSEAHYLLVGRLATLAAVLIGVCCSALSLYFNNLMEHVQLIFALLNAPFWAVFLLGVATRRVKEGAAVAGLLSGVLLGTLHALAVQAGWLHYGSRMSSNFYAAVLAFGGALSVCAVASARGTASAEQRHKPRIQSSWWTPEKPMLWVLALLLVAGCAWMNYLWW